MRVIYKLTFAIIFLPAAFSDDATVPLPPNFPTGITLNITRFTNWAEEVNSRNLYTAWPTSEDQVLILANWALAEGYTMRASGLMHTWAPLTVPATEPPTNVATEILQVASPELFWKLVAPFISIVNIFTGWFGIKITTPTTTLPPKILLVKTLLLKNMTIISDSPSNSSFRAQPGIIMSDVLLNLEQAKLGFLAVPAPGDITLGGLLAIGAHGTGIPADNEQKSPGHTYGSLSNLMMEVTAVVFDNDTGKFILKNYSRTDYEFTALAVHIGRAFLTSMTLRVGPLQYLRCRSYTDIPATELFADPATATNNTRTTETFLKAAGRMEIILFPFTTNPWLKVWEVAPTQPNGSRLVTEPFNYGFSDSIPTPIANTVGTVTPQLFLAKVLGPIMYEYTKLSLDKGNIRDIWGTSRTTLNYVKATTLRYTANGYAILTARANVQRVLYDVYRIYDHGIKSNELKGMYPVNGPLEVRVTGVDNVEDVMVNGAQPAGISPTCPSTTWTAFDTAIWVDVLTFSGTPNYPTFMAEMAWEYYNLFQPPYALMRAEWCKGWAYNVTAQSGWSNVTRMTNNILPNQCNWNAVRTILNSLDPQNVFTCPLLSILFSIEVPITN